MFCKHSIFFLPATTPPPAPVVRVCHPGTQPPPRHCVFKCVEVHGHVTSRPAYATNTLPPGNITSAACHLLPCLLYPIPIFFFFFWGQKVRSPLSRDFFYFTEIY